jgi:hypothetical protein
VRLAKVLECRKARARGDGSHHIGRHGGGAAFRPRRNGIVPRRIGTGRQIYL